MSEEEVKTPLILKTKGHDTRFYNLNLKRYRYTVLFENFPDLLISRKTGHPITPLYYNKDNVWSEVLLSKALKDRVVVEGKRGYEVQGLYRQVVNDKFKKHFYDIYKHYTPRSSNRTKGFISCIIHLALEYGFKGQIISVDKAGLDRLGMKQPAAKEALRKLHERDIIISMSGHGLPFNNPRKNMPMAFMLHPSQENDVNKMVIDLKNGDISIEDIKEL